MNTNVHRNTQRFHYAVIVMIFLVGMFHIDGFNIALAERVTPYSIPTGIDSFDETAFDVKPDIDMISGWEWPPDTEVTITLPDHENFSTSTISTSEGDVDFPPLPVDIQVGDYVTMSDGFTTKFTTVVPLAFGSYSLTDDTVSGTADPYAGIWGFTCNGLTNDCGGTETTANKNGVWVLDFSTIGIEPGSDGGVYRWDDNGDATSFMWRVPRFSIAVNNEVLHGIQWNPYSEIDVFIDGLLVATGLSTQEGRVEIEDLHVKTDQKVKLTDGMYTKVHVVRSLKLTSVDPMTDKVKGTADPGSVVTISEIIDWDQPPAASIPVTTKADGTWVANFGSVGWDIGNESFGNAMICDNDGDCTEMVWESPPDDINPDYGEKLTTSKVGFDWPDEPGADLYKIQLSTREDFSTLVFGAKTADSSYAYDVKLINNITYYWRIRPFFGDDKGDWSLAWKFFSMNPLSSPILVKPANKEIVTTSKPIFSWQPVVNAGNYLIQLSKSSLFDTIYLKETVPSTSYGETMDPLPDGKYYWRVRAIDASGGKGPWSEIRIVKVDAVP